MNGIKRVSIELDESIWLNATWGAKRAGFSTLAGALRWSAHQLADKAPSSGNGIPKSGILGDKERESKVEP